MFARDISIFTSQHCRYTISGRAWFYSPKNENKLLGLIPPSASSRDLTTFSLLFSKTPFLVEWTGTDRSFNTKMDLGGKSQNKTSTVISWSKDVANPNCLFSLLESRLQDLQIQCVAYFQMFLRHRVASAGQWGVPFPISWTLIHIVQVIQWELVMLMHNIMTMHYHARTTPGRKKYKKVIWNREGCP